MDDEAKEQSDDELVKRLEEARRKSEELARQAKELQETIALLREHFERRDRDPPAR